MLSSGKPQRMKVHVFFPLPFGEVDNAARAIAAMSGTGMSANLSHIFNSGASVCIKNGPETAPQVVTGSFLNSLSVNHQSNSKYSRHFCVLGHFYMSGIWLPGSHHAFSITDPNVILWLLLFDVIGCEITIHNQTPHCLCLKENYWKIIDKNDGQQHTLCIGTENWQAN